MGNLANALQQLRAERREVQSQLEKLDKAIAVVELVNGEGTPQKVNQPSRITSAPTRFISKASRLKMAQAQRARWAKIRTESQPAAGTAKTSGSAPIKRTMSVAARRKIAAAQRARWARARKESKPVLVAAKRTGLPPVRHMSVAARRRLSALQRARWAKLRAEQRKAA
jgi:hypothetical protein